ncbi:hypothetical protein B1757_09785 [Acidithiobacillus marinus]|uniref:Quinol oxidase n=1 Tax=Acidithiobacillus marinus TaxID=187490 RepID=A0A2I1DKJ3_9PROT|nr:TQO small subunit DoxD [Acidithiobacillus marinus]PKY10384.1 hypothetical protein B1757_09785 [Acidithiobacillus marinus]
MSQSTSVQTPSWTSESIFALVGVFALSIRLVQGWIFWGGASRRLFYDFHSIHGTEYAVKMDPHVAGYVANKLVHAMPGSVFPGLIQTIIQSGGFLHFMVWFWTIAELIVGVGLILGIATRILALGSVGLNISLMLIFGWMGSTCVDEWTMASAGFAMGATLMLTGGGSWSLDHWLGRMSPALSNRSWFRLLFSGPLSVSATKKWGVILGILSLLFTAAFYQYIHGAVISPLHARVNFHHYSLSLKGASADTNGDVRFFAYVNAGPDTAKLYLIKADLINGEGQNVEQWSGQQLTAISSKNIDNRFTQAWASRFSATDYGIGGVTGAKAWIRLPGNTHLASGNYKLRLTDIDGKHWSTVVTFK